MKMNTYIFILLVKIGSKPQDITILNWIHLLKLYLKHVKEKSIHTQGETQIYYTMKAFKILPWVTISSSGQKNLKGYVILDCN